MFLALVLKYVNFMCVTFLKSQGHGYELFPAEGQEVADWKVYGSYG